jgi:hypothetical protein
MESWPAEIALGQKERMMTVHQCPKCELRFAWKTELDDHCWHDHQEFRHEYPVGRRSGAAAEPPGSDTTPARPSTPPSA